MKPTTTPGNASGKVSIATSTARPGNAWRCRNSPAMVAIDERDDGGRRRQHHRVDQGRAVARLGEDGRVGGKALRPAGADDHQPHHRQHEERQHHDGKRQQAEPDEGLRCAWKEMALRGQAGAP